MNFFIASLIINLKRLTQSGLFLGGGALFLLCAVLLSFADLSASPVSVGVGIMTQDSDVLALDIVSNLKTGGDYVNFTVYGAAAENEMTDAVKNRALECAYVIGPNLYEKVLKDDLTGIITRYQSPATVTQGLIDDIVSAAVVKAISPVYAARAASDTLKMDFFSAQSVITEKAAYYLNEYTFVQPQSESFNAPPYETGGYVPFRLLRGALAVALFIFAYTQIPLFMPDNENAALKCLSARQYTIFALSRFIASSLCMLFICLLLAPSFAYKNLQIGGAKTEIVALCVYIIQTQIIAGVCCEVFSKKGVYYGLFIFALIIQIIFGNLFFDLCEISSNLSRFQVLPSAFYMSVLTGKKNAALLATAALCVFYAVFLKIKTRAC